MNSIGLFFAGLRYEGIILFQGMLLCATCLISFHYLSDYFGAAAAFLATLFLLVGLTLQSGNFPEEYNLFFQSLSLLLFTLSTKERCSERRNLVFFLVIGVLAALSFFTRQNMIGLWVVIGLNLLFKVLTDPRERKRSYAALASMSTGFAVVTVVIILLMANQWSEYIDSSWTFNLISAKVDHTWTPFTRQPAINLMFWIPLSWLAIIGFPIVVIKFLQLSRSFNPLSVVIAWAPLEFFLASINRQYHGHYNLQMLLPMQIIIACLLGTIFLGVKHMFAKGKYQTSNKNDFQKRPYRSVGITSLKLVVSASAVLVTLLLMRQPDANVLRESFLPPNYPQLRKTADRLLRQQERMFKYRPFVESSRPYIPYIKQKLSPDETVLIFGDAGYAHFYSERHSPIRQFYFYHIDRGGNRLGSIYVGELVQAVETAAASMIVMDIPMWNRAILMKHPAAKQRITAALTESYELDRVFGQKYVYLKKD